MYTEGDVSLVVKIKNFRTISPTTKEGKKIVSAVSEMN